MVKATNQPDAVITAPFGPLGVWVEGGRLRAVRLLPEGTPEDCGSTAGVDRVVCELKAYLENGAHRFSIELAEWGTPFQKSVWRLLRKIPAGDTVSYKDLAGKLHTSPRAIGAACRANPIPLVTPCHRVIASSGIGGFMGETSGAPLRMKEWLLRHECRA